MELHAKLVRAQLNFFKPFVANCSLEVTRKGQDKLGELMTAIHKREVYVREHDFGGFQGAWLTPKDKRDRTADLMTASCDRLVILGVFTLNPSVQSAKSAEFHSNLPTASTRFRAHLGHNLGQGVRLYFGNPCTDTINFF